jgi:hypothetical protein
MINLRKSLMLALVFVGLLFSITAYAADTNKLSSDLTSDNGQVVLAALKSLKAMGPGAASAVPAIVDLLKTKKTYPYQDYGLDNVVYPEAFETLKAIGVKSDDVLRVAIDYYQNSADYLDAKPYALAVISDFGEQAAPVAPVLAGQLEQENTRVADSRRIIDVLGKIGPAAVAAVPALVKIATASTLGSDRVQALSALNKIAPSDRRILKAYADAAWKRPGNSEDQKIYVLFSDYLSGYGKLSQEDLVLLAGYMNNFTKRESAEDRNPPGHDTSTNPNYLSVAKIFLSYPESADLIMPSLAERIRQLDMHMKDFQALLELAGDFGARADSLAQPIYERATSREHIGFGFLRPLSIKVLNEIGTSSALDKAKSLSVQR